MVRSGWGVMMVGGVTPCLGKGTWGRLSILRPGPGPLGWRSSASGDWDGVEAVTHD